MVVTVVRATNTYLGTANPDMNVVHSLAGMAHSVVGVAETIVSPRRSL